MFWIREISSFVVKRPTTFDKCIGHLGCILAIIGNLHLSDDELSNLLVSAIA